MTNMSPWIYAHSSFHFASLYYIAQLSPVSTIIYLPQNSHHTYLLWHFHSHSEIYCHATPTVLSHDLCRHFHIAIA